MKCIYCGKKADFIAFGCSICKEHLKYMEFQVPAQEVMMNFANQKKDEVEE